MITKGSILNSVDKATVIVVALPSSKYISQSSLVSNRRQHHIIDCSTTRTHVVFFESAAIEWVICGRVIKMVVVMLRVPKGRPWVLYGSPER